MTSTMTLATVQVQSKTLCWVLCCWEKLHRHSQWLHFKAAVQVKMGTQCYHDTLCVFLEGSFFTLGMNFI